MNMNKLLAAVVLSATIVTSAFAGDNYQQILDQCPMLKDSDRQFFITIKSVKKENQDPDGGWRWHKWGPYIGTHEITTEYLYDEPIVEEVFVYHIYEKEN